MHMPERLTAARPATFPAASSIYPDVKTNEKLYGKGYDPDAILHQPGMAWCIFEGVLRDHVPGPWLRLRTSFFAYSNPTSRQVQPV